MHDCNRTCRRRGFTWIELLTVASGLFLLAAMTLPAVQHAREDARMQKCQSNLKQLGLGIHNYHDTHKRFPPGWTTRRQKGAGHPSTGWMSSLLPFVDRGQLFKQLEMTHGVYTTQDQSLLKQSISLYRCPADSLGAANVLRGGWGTSNYAGNYGAAPIARWSDSFTNSNWPGQGVAPRTVRAADRRYLEGVFSMNRGSSFSRITDGSSNTFLIGERSVVGGGALWPGPRSNFHESDVVADASYSSPLNGGNPAFSSRHRRIVNFLMCDGSVHPLNVKIDSRPNWGLLQKLAAERDGL